jgi:hypothetical protein
LYIPEYPASSSFSNGAEQLAWHIKGFGEDERGGRMRSLRKFTLIFVIAVLLSNIAWGWGREGHRIIATVAEDHLNETTKVMIQSLIGNNHLYSIASWADDIRKERRDTAPWHYVNIPFGSTYNASRDCPPPKSCVVEKINEFMRVLTDKKAPREQRAEALKWVVHLVGDIHQPLHAAKEAEGGNGVHVKFLGDDRCGPHDCNLHGVWDTSMILHAGLKPEDYDEQLEKLIKSEHMAAQDGGTPEEWANESVRLAQAAWVQDGANLDEQYYRKEITVVDRQMALAGLRLAKMLNETIGKMTPRDFDSKSAMPSGIANPSERGY